MDKPIKQMELRILLLEDEPTDAELMEDALREAGLPFIAKRVDTREAFIRALEEFKPDIVLADYKLPGFDGVTALKIVRQQYPAIPVVMVTGAVGDEKAIELLMLGAKDYILKDRLARLGPAVKRALSEEQSIRDRKAAEEALRESEADLRALVEHSPVAMIVDSGVDLDEKIVMMNRRFTELFGYTTEDVPDVRHWWPLAYPDEKYREELRIEWTRRVEQAIRNHGEIKPMEAEVTCKDGTCRYVRVSLSSIGSRNIIAFEDLTELKQIEDALREASDRNRSIMETANDAIICMKPDGIIHLWNNKAKELFGYTAEEAVGHELHQLIVPERYRAKALAGLQQFAKTGTGYVVGKTLELTAWHKGQQEFPVELSVSAMHIRGEWHATGIIRDITGRKRAEARIQKLTRLYATLSQTNQVIVRATSREELFRNICEGAVTHGKFSMAWVGLVDETTRMVKPVHHYGAEKGYLSNIAISIDDVPEGRGPTGTAIRENCVNYVNDYATDERTMPWREAALKRGFRGAAGVPLRIKGQAIGALTLYADEVDFFDIDQLNLLGELATDISFALDGFDREAERKAAENKLAEGERHFRAVAESASDAIVTIGGSGNILDWNKAAEQLFNRTKSEMSGQPLTVLMPERFRELHKAGLARVTHGGAPHVIGKTVELAGLRKDGSEFPLELSLAQWRTSEGIFFTAIIRDITARKQVEKQVVEQYEHVAQINAQLTEANKQLKQAQDQLLQSEKMAAIGLLAAGVAHEINNPIGYMNSNMGTLEKHLADIFAVIDKFEAAERLMVDANDPLLKELRQFKEQINLAYIRKDTMELIAESRQGLERVKRIVLDLKNFSHADSEDQWRWADIHQVLDTTLNIVCNELKYKCEVVKEYGVLPEIYCLPTQLDQVFMNLLVNAAQAIEVRGKITLRTGQEGDRIWAEVSDTGKGIPPEAFPHLFDPFFTTKPVGKGTGLGLSVSYSIVEKHHGKIEVHSEVGKGSTFRVWLPVQQPVVKEAA